MSRKNIFQLVDESFDIQNEIIKISTLFDEEYYFSLNGENYTFESLLVDKLFYGWRYRGSCLSVSEYLERANATIPSSLLPWAPNIPQETIINFLEAMENFIKLLSDYDDYLNEHFDYICYDTFNSVFVDLIKTLEKHMGLLARKMDDKVLLYPESAVLEKVIESCNDENVQWEMIRYVRDTLGVAEKRKILVSLGSYIEPVLKSRLLQNAGYRQLESDVGFMLNNFHVRHNNKEGAKAQDYIVTLNDKQLEEWYDKIFNAILSVIIICEHISTQREVAYQKSAHNWRR